MSILEQAKALQPDMIRIRRHIHSHPELSGQEKETSAFVEKELRAIGGFDIRTGVGGYGILAEIHGETDGPVIAVRADMDALSIYEETGLEYASRNSGVMHACGHDFHTTMLLGAAKLLQENRSSIKGTIRLIFQPAEEASPKGGSAGMIADGALDKVEAVMGIHCWPDLPLGVIGIRTGEMMAASDHFSVSIQGKSAHGAQPHLGCDALIAGMQYVQTLQTIISRNRDPMKPAVITVGKFNAGSRYNVIPENCMIEGTVRTYNPEVRDMIESRMNEVLQGISQTFGCQAALNYERGYPAVRNDPRMMQHYLSTAENLFGKENTRVLPQAALTAEDFSRYSERVPGAYGFIGTTKPGDPVWPLHSCHYAPDEDALYRGACLLAEMALTYQSQQ